MMKRRDFFKLGAALPAVTIIPAELPLRSRAQWWATRPVPVFGEPTQANLDMAYMYVGGGYAEITNDSSVILHITLEHKNTIAFSVLPHKTARERVQGRVRVISYFWPE